jgi:hypothetical protein
MAPEGLSRNDIDNVLGKRDDSTSGWETSMNNIFWFIGVIVVVVVVLGFLGFR